MKHQHSTMVLCDKNGLALSDYTFVKCTTVNCVDRLILCSERQETKHRFQLFFKNLFVLLFLTGVLRKNILLLN